jgi:hypothetical protein
MPHNSKNQAGFSAGIIIAAVLVLAVIGAAGFFVFKKSSDKAATTSAPTATSQEPMNTDNTDVNTKAPIDHSEGGKYLVIKEWGVRVLLPDSLKGNAFYSLREVGSDKYANAVAADINSKFFQPECRDTAEDLSLDVVRTTAQIDDSAPLAYKRNSLRAGDYWYHNTYDKNGCSKFLEGTKAEAFNELKESIGTVESY